MCISSPLNTKNNLLLVYLLLLEISKENGTSIYLCFIEKPVHVFEVAEYYVSASRLILRAKSANGSFISDLVKLNRCFSEYSSKLYDYSCASISAQGSPMSWTTWKINEQCSVSWKK